MLIILLNTNNSVKNSIKADKNRETIFETVCDTVSKCVCNSMNALKYSTKIHQIRTDQRICATK